MHAVLGMTLIHRRCVNERLTEATLAERDQLSLTLIHYDARLKSPLTAEDSDAMLATSTLINAFAFASIPTDDPMASWPMVSTPADLQWLAVQQGPELIMAASAQWMMQSVFASAFADFDIGQESIPSIEPPASPTELFHTLESFCKVTHNSKIDVNPYSTYLQILAPMLPIPATTTNMAKFLPFVSAIRPPFLDLLGARDARALAILAWWYALICPLRQWWLVRRAHVECTAICTFLQQKFGHELDVVLDFPARRCGYQLIEI